MHDEHNEETRTLAEYFLILKRRRYYFLVPTLLISVAALLLALSWPATYVSTAKIMVEEQDIPDEFLATVRRSGAQRIPIIQQQLLTTVRIEEIVEKLDLYPDLTEWTSNQVAELFRSNVLFEFVDAEVTDSRTGRPIDTTIAFVLGFYSDDPSIAQQVTNELVTLFLQENLRSRSATVSSVSEFLSDEAETLAAELSRREAELASFKEANAGALPELYQYNLSMLERTEQQLLDVDRRIQEVDLRIIDLSSKLAQLSPHSSTLLPSGEVVMSDRERLRYLLLEYRRMSDVYGEAHPDLRRMKREIESLRTSPDLNDNSKVLQDRLLQEQARLKSMQSEVPDTDARIEDQKQVVLDIEAMLQKSLGEIPSTDGTADNPAYILVKTQLQSANSESNNLIDQRTELRNKIERFEGLIRRSPQVEKEYQAVVRGYETAANAYQELRSNLARAEVAKSAEEGSRIGRFTVLEPAFLPLEPVAPNRRGILAMGCIFAIAAGIAFVMFAEMSDAGIRGAHAVAAIVGAPPMISVPYIENTQDKRAATRHFSYVFASVMVLTLIIVVYVHVFIRPIGILD